MLIRRETDIKASEITPKELYLNRRQFMAAAAVAAGEFSLPSLLGPSRAFAGNEKLDVAKRQDYAGGEKLTKFEYAANYNNFFEYSSGKEGIAMLSKDLKTRPWTVVVEGLVKKARRFDIDELMRMFPLEERIYRHRCVEAWSMVVPWVGFPLGDFIKLCEPTGEAKFVEFTTLLDPVQMPGQRRKTLDWPYREGLRMDEALHPLAMLVVGLYGEAIPNQNGAPLRLVVPWKYGFKSIKTIVRVSFVSEMPATSWAMANPDEYGFYANVNPTVHHPRWKQNRERRLGEFFKRDTLMFNGYGEDVAHLYKGMDLRKFF